MNKLRDKKGKSIIEELDNYTVVDIETTGLNPYYNKILEISAIRVRNKKIVDEFSMLINPHERIPYFIKNLTGITDEMVEDAEELEYVLQKFKKFLGSDIIVGHNVNFDVNFLYDNFENVLGETLSNDFLDTLRIARRLLPELNHHRLDDLTEYYGVESRNKHRALNDCLLTYKVYINMMNMIKDKYSNWNNFKERVKINL